MGELARRVVSGLAAVARSPTVLLDIESLRAFLTVLDAGGMSRAAEQLHLTQSAVSWKIKRLEARVGRPLLVRDGRRLRATDAGDDLVAYAQLIVGAHDEAVARLTGSHLSGPVRIGADVDSAASVLDLAARFHRLHPGAELDLRVHPCSDLTAAVDRGELDVVVMTVVADQVRPGDVELDRDELVWATSAADPETREPVPLAGSACDQHRLDLARRVLDDAGIPHRLAFHGPGSADVESAIAAGLGVGLVARSVVDGERLMPWPRAARLPAVPDVVRIERRAAGATGPAVDAFADELRAITRIG